MRTIAAAPVVEAQAEAQSALGKFDLARIHVGALADADAGIGNLHRVHRFGHALVIRVHGVSLGHRKYGQLRLQILLHRAEIVQMVAGKIGKARGGEANARHAVHGQRMRGDLHHHEVQPCFLHPLQRLLKLHRIRSRLPGGVFGLADQRAHGADQADPVSALLQNRLQKKTRGRLALRAGDADDLQRLRRVPVERRREIAHGEPHVFHENLRTVHRQLSFHHQRRRAAGNRLRRVFMRVEVHAPGCRRTDSRAQFSWSRCTATGPPCFRLRSSDMK